MYGTFVLAGLVLYSPHVHLCTCRLEMSFGRRGPMCSRRASQGSTPRRGMGHGPSRTTSRSCSRATARYVHHDKVAAASNAGFGAGPVWWLWIESSPPCDVACMVVSMLTLTPYAGRTSRRSWQPSAQTTRCVQQHRRGNAALIHGGFLQSPMTQHVILLFFAAAMGHL